MAGRDRSSWSRNSNRPDSNVKQGMWVKAIKTALADHSNPKKKIKAGEALFKIADQMVAAATDRTDPNFQFAVKEIGMRLDGKPTEHIQIGAPNGSAHELIGISAAFATLVRAAAEREVVGGETLVPDRPLLPTEIRPKANGHGKGMDIPAMSGSSGES